MNMNSMSAQIAPSPETDNVVELADSPGRRLRQARQSRGLQVEQIANQLHLVTRHITALERDDYQALPGPVFISGYMRNYARLLGLDPEPLIEAYRAAAPETRPQLSTTRPSGPRQVTSGHLWVRLVSLALVTGLGVLAFMWWKSQSAYDPLPPLAPEEVAADVASSTPAEVPTEVALSTPEPPAPVAAGLSASAGGDSAEPEATIAAAPMEAAIEEQPAVVLDAPTSPETEPVTGAPSAETDVQQPETTSSEQTPTSGDENLDSAVSPEEVVMVFSGPCWVDIRDSERKFKLFGEMSQGDRRVLEGKPPYSVILGNAAAVDITVGGVPYDLTGVTRGNVARFTLNPSQTP
jgi:cytoskeleton protein RodZ